MKWVPSTAVNYNAPNATTGQPSMSETMELQAEDGTVIATFYKTASGAPSFKMGANAGTAVAGVTVVQSGAGGGITLDITLLDFLVTLVLNGTSTAGGGSLLFTFNQGIVQPVGGSSNLTVRNALDKSFLAGVGSAAADTGGTLTSTEISFLPQTAATTSSGVGTCKMKATVTTPTPGSKLDGTSTAVPIYLNACLNADGTGATLLYFSGTIRLNLIFDGDN